MADGYNEEAVKELQHDLEEGVEELRAEMGPDVGQDDISFDLSIGIALCHESRPDAEEFLRREWGYVPQQYRQHQPRQRSE
jgi:GGDEF domain-containing protein